MSRLFLLLVTVALLLSVSSPAWATERLAVLELSGKELSLEERSLLTDVVRGAIVSAAGGNIQVMTRENMEVMLSDMGLDATCISEGACEVETARNLGVDYVASGSIVRLSGTLVASLKIHETRTGQLLATGRAQAADVLGLLDPITGAAGILLGNIAGRQPTAPGAESLLLNAAPPAAACQDGRARTPDTDGRCCWPGQGWSGTACVGSPTACPDGWTRAADGCDVTPLPDGMVRTADHVHACWPGQAWSASKASCVGMPTSCPTGLVPFRDAAGCLPSGAELASAIRAGLAKARRPTSTAGGEKVDGVTRTSMRQITGYGLDGCSLWFADSERETEKWGIMYGFESHLDDTVEDKESRTTVDLRGVQEASVGTSTWSGVLFLGSDSGFSVSNVTRSSCAGTRRACSDSPQGEHTDVAVAKGTEIPVDDSDGTWATLIPSLLALAAECSL